MTPRTSTAFSPTACVLLALLLPHPAAADSGYGLAVGLATPLAPSDTLGVSVGLSAFRTGLDGPRSLLRARGEVLGIITSDSKAIMPTLVRELGVELGRVDIFLDAGVQIFGFAWREDYAVFATVGFTGGVGMALNVSERLRLGVRGAVTWLPSDTTAIINEPESEDKPTFAFVTVLLTLEYMPKRPRRKPRELMPPPLLD